LAGESLQPPPPCDSLAHYMFPLLESIPVGNWKQVQARIRKARTGADAPAKLEQLFLKTRDGMVAFELAKVHEEGQREGDALDWYRKAFERFRRDEWRVKAAEAIQRLGGTPPPIPEPSADSASASESESEPQAQPEAVPVPTPRSWAALPDHLYHENESAASNGADESEPNAESDADSEVAPAAAEADARPPDSAQPAHADGPGGGKRRRRGRRGGRRHRKGGGGAPHVAGQPASHTAPPAPTHSPTQSPTHVPSHSPGADSASPAPLPPRPAMPPPPRHERHEDEAPAGWVGPKAEEMRTRAGDPGLASRVARLEMQIRRLLACPPHKVSEGDLAPAGPGVLLLSDSDLTTHYHICACDTLRIEISRLTRSDRGGRSRGREQFPLRSLMAEHLEISESQVSKYLESHCVVRWLQLDEGAPRVANFATAVLEPILKE
jgi:hypothetical protein